MIRVRRHGDSARETAQGCERLVNRIELIVQLLPLRPQQTHGILQIDHPHPCSYVTATSDNGAPG